MAREELTTLAMLNLVMFCVFRSVLFRRAKTERKKTEAKPRFFACQHRPIFPGRFQPSIVGTNELNFRVRDGNGWTLAVKDTDYELCSGKRTKKNE